MDKHKSNISSILDSYLCTLGILVLSFVEVVVYLAGDYHIDYANDAVAKVYISLLFSLCVFIVIGMPFYFIKKKIYTIAKILNICLLIPVGYILAKPIASIIFFSSANF